ncbi:hypothetical protein BC567DRAFT_233084 [Phyllosticta citribraziliensis]
MDSATKAERSDIKTELYPRVRLLKRFSADRNPSESSVCRPPTNGRATDRIPSRAPRTTPSSTEFCLPLRS